MSKANVITTLKLLTPENIADEISNLYVAYKGARSSWEREVLEIRAFVTATSTQTTENDQNGFSNNTTIPKIAHIATNLKANYAAHLFSNANWIHFEAFDKTAADQKARKLVEAYARTKARRKGYEEVLGTCLDDYVNAGCAFAQQRYIREYARLPDGQQGAVTYEGEVLDRIPPQDIVFDVTATSFQAANKIIRKTYSIGYIARLVMEGNTEGFDQKLLDDIRTRHTMVRNAGISKTPTGLDWQSINLKKDGFGDLLSYFRGDMIEVLEFYGDMYSMADGTYLPDHKIIVVDRVNVVSKIPNTSANGSDYIYYATPEKRPDNLMGMSPLARLIGMQFKLDKLENMRADIFDLIAHPTIVEKGSVDFYGVRGEPDGRYVIDEDGDVRYLVPDTTILNADFQIRNTMEMMEELAGSPKTASGQRTAGEKTKFEMQLLDNGGNRIFRDRTVNFERNFIEPILNDMIQLGRDNIGTVDMVSSTSNEFGAEEFINISSDDLAVSGQLRARGSSLFAEKANALQNIIQIFSQPVAEKFAQHTSGLALAKTLEELGDYAQYGIITKNIAIQENAEAQQLANASQDNSNSTDVIAASGAPTDETVPTREQVEEDDTRTGQ